MPCEYVRFAFCARSTEIFRLMITFRNCFGKHSSIEGSKMSLKGKFIDFFLFIFNFPIVENVIQVRENANRHHHRKLNRLCLPSSIYCSSFSHFHIFPLKQLQNFKQICIHYKHRFVILFLLM